MKKAFVLILTLTATLVATAQERWKAAVDTVGTEGYYNICLDPQIIGLSGGNDFGDVRILDEQGVEVPYMVRQAVPVQQVSSMEMYPLLKNEGRDSLNVIVVDNAARERIERFYIVMRAADVGKHVSVRGGDRPGQWYVVRQRAPLHSQRGTDGSEIAAVDIPGGDYRYYEITLTNSQGSPLSVTGVGKVDSRSIYGQYIPVESGGIAVREDSLRRTVVTFPVLRGPYRIDRLEIGVAGSGLYRRDARLITGGRNLSMTISSKESNIFQTVGFPVDSTTRIVISNGDNPPLTVATVRMWTLARYLCARLESGKHYTLVTGAEGRSLYDLEYFRDELDRELPIVNTEAPVREEITPAPAPAVRFFERPGFLWTVMALAGVILVGACLQAMRAARKR